MTRYSLDEIGDYLSQMSWPERLADVLKPRQREGAVHGSVLEAATGAPAGFTESSTRLAPGAAERQGIYAPRGGRRMAAGRDARPPIFTGKASAVE